MSKQQIEMISDARIKYGKISPCGNFTEWTHCFTMHNGTLLLWFNTDDHSTHLEARNIDHNN